jgi:hypothetical protein
MASSFGQRYKLLLSVKGSIIHHNNRIYWQGGQKTLLKPQLKQGTIHGSLVLQRGNNFLIYLSRNNTCAFVFMTANHAIYSYAFRRISIFSIQVAVHTCFIHISNARHRYVSYCLQVRGYFYGVLFLVAFRLFLRVIPRRLKALNTATFEQPKASPISCK